MASYEEARVNKIKLNKVSKLKSVAKNQLNKLKSAAENKAGTSLKTTQKKF